MTAAFEHRRSRPVNRGQSRFFAPLSRAQRRALRSRNTRSENRLAGRKTAPGIFFAPAPETRREAAPQVTTTHQESATYVFVFVSGCAVAPNSGASQTAVTASSPLAPLSFGFGVTANIPFSSASINYNWTNNTISSNVSLTPTVGYSVIAGPPFTYNSSTSGPILFTVGGTTTIALIGPVPIAARLNISFTTETFFGVDVPWPSSLTFQIRARRRI